MHRLLTIFLCLFTGFFLVPTSPAQGLSVDLGPFSFSLGPEVKEGSPNYGFFHDPICQAIKEKNLVAMYVQREGNIERLIIEPYSFGYNKEGNLTLQGFHVEGFDLTGPLMNGQGEGIIGGIFTEFKGDEWVKMKVEKVVKIQVLKDTDFKVRKEAFSHLEKNDAIIKKICEIQPAGPELGPL